jgi:hypothetical protein
MQTINIFFIVALSPRFSKGHSRGKLKILFLILQ